METGKKTILIVDDSPLIVKRLIDMLNELENLEWIKKAGNYSEAVQLITDTEPNILLLDINLPDKSGIDILRITKENNPSTRVIMITNQANEYYRKLCMRLGADYFIDKTKEFEQIAEIIETIINH
ncbi:MAG: response regulator transcription factor [Chitinophagaceae bacterium]